uniref:Uncharacterized protein n=1 Tax=Anas platyrhynchos platyrhynchos TaxID=8840 RepID=A0A493SSW4_ANAPP
MEACAVICVSRTVRSSVSTVLAKRQIKQCHLISIQISSYKGGEEKEQEEIAADQR